LFAAKFFNGALKPLQRTYAKSQNIKAREENPLDATEWLIVIIICSTCFGHLYAHHQELETILVLLPPMVYIALFAGGPG